MARRLSSWPDVVTMDIRMPRMDGLEAIRHIMADNPVPIVVVTSIDLDREMGISSQATKLGAVSVLRRPVRVTDDIVVIILTSNKGGMDGNVEVPKQFVYRVQDRLRGVDAGAAEFVTKPVKAKELVKRVKSVLWAGGFPV